MTSQTPPSSLYVTQPYLPPLEEFIPYLEAIWESKWITNNGPFHAELEKELCAYLGVEHISLFTNGTLALITALQALRITGEVITTPFSFVATTHSLHWNGIKPVFVDIDPITFNLDPKKIEAAITPQTTAIMPVHVYGVPCDVAAIEKIADIYGLKVIYDAAHAFGVRIRGESVLQFGDMSILSFHATKVFNTFEGGAIVCKDASTKRRIDFLKNFGFADEVTVVGAGINAKMDEVHAAFGLLQLKHMPNVRSARSRIDELYRDSLSDIPGIVISDTPDWIERNFSYFPILIEKTFPLDRDQLYGRLQENGIYARRYFYPLISQFPMYRGLLSASRENLPVASRVAEQVICLPIYPNLSEEEVMRVVGVIVEASAVLPSVSIQPFLTASTSQALFREAH